MNKIINSPEEIKEKEGWMVFLAGPMKASPRGWRNKLVKVDGEMPDSEWVNLINGIID